MLYYVERFSIFVYVHLYCLTSMCSVADFLKNAFDVCKTSLAIFFLLSDPLGECSFKSAIKNSRFAFRICFKLYSDELCLFYAF